VNHAVDVVVEADEQTKFGDVLDFAFDVGADRMGFGKHFPRVALGLLEPQGNAALGAVDFQNHDLNLLRGGHDLAGVHVLLGPGHFRDVNQTFNTGFQLHEGAVIGDVGDTALMHGADGIHFFNSIPRIGLQLLHAKADAVGVLVDLDDLNLDGFADRQDFRRVVDATPSHIGDVQQAVNAAQIHERTVFGDVLDHTVNGLAFGQVADNFGTLFCTRFFKDRTTRNNDVATATVHFQDLERLLHAHQRASITHGTHVNLATRQERHSAAQINSKAAFDTAKDRAINAGLGRIGLLKTIPCFFAASFLARDLGFAAGILNAVQIHFHSVADVDVRLLAGVREFFQIDAAFHLVADIDDGLARFDRDNPAFDNRTLFGGVNLEAFLQEGFEFVHSFRVHAVGSFSHFSQATRLAPPVFAQIRQGPWHLPDPFRARA